MSISDSEIMADGRVPRAAATAARTGRRRASQRSVAGDPHSPTATDRPHGHRRAALPRSATGSSRSVQICCDFVCACIALPLSLIVLSQRLRGARRTRPAQLLTNIKVDSLFPVAVVLALALGRASTG